MLRSVTRVSTRCTAASMRLQQQQQQLRHQHQRAASNVALRSTVWVPTEKEVPADAAIPSHQLLIRGGFIRKSGHGVFTFLPLGKRVLSKLEAIIDDEMMAIGGNKLDLPLMIPAELWATSGRWQTRGPELLTITDRRGALHALAPTHEESITSLVAQHFHAGTSNTDTTLRLYQVGKKFRDEIRPRFGLLRAREFVMKDMYSFDNSRAAAAATYSDVVCAYTSILATRLQLPIAKVEADSGSIGGSSSHEFHVVAPIGEDALLSCSSCDYAANVEKAVGALPPVNDSEPSADPVSDELTQALANIEALATAGDMAAWHTLAMLAAPVNGAYVTAQVLRTPAVATVSVGDASTQPQVVIVLARRDRTVNALSLKRFFNGDELEPVDSDAAADALGASKTSRLAVFIDDSLAVSDTSDVVDVVNPSSDAAVAMLIDSVARQHEALGLVTVERGHFRAAEPGDACVRCSDNGVGGALVAARGIEVGHVFDLGTKYSKPFSAHTPTGEPLEMGCFGMGVTRLVAAAVEVSHDVHGIVWPAAIAPYTVVVMAIGATDSDAPLAQTAKAIAHDLASGVSRLDVMLDDRWSERPGSKLAESELLGYPFRVVVGKRFALDGVVEVQTRATLDKVYMAPNALAQFFADKVARGKL